MKRGFLKAQVFLLLFIYTAIVVFYSSAGAIRASAISIECSAGAAFSSEEATAAVKDGVRVSSRIYELLFGKEAKAKQVPGEEILLYPGGSVFGVLIDEVGATVCGHSNCGKLLTGDRIIRINGKKVDNAQTVEDAVMNSGGSKIELEIVRSGEVMEIDVTPKLKDNEYTLGVTLRSRTAGIGTITFIDPKSLAFGGLGHGVTDGESGALISVESGRACGVVLGGCKKGEAGRAGELSGVLNKNVFGSILTNNECGVFGVLEKLPDYAKELLPVAKRSEVKSGEAEIISTVKNGKRQAYKIQIEEIDYDSTSSKSFRIKVTDPALIAMTGGIVRGMSGSCIVQNGKIIGAVTHVMVNDPTEGYGIFIENMLNASQAQAQQKAA